MMGSESRGPPTAILALPVLSSIILGLMVRRYLVNLVDIGLLTTLCLRGPPIAMCDFPYPPLASMIFVVLSPLGNLAELAAALIIATSYVPLILALSRVGGRGVAILVAPTILLLAARSLDSLAAGLLAASIALLEAGRYELSGLALALACSTATYPLASVPIAVAAAWRRRAVERLLAPFTVAYTLVNLPFIMANPDRWGYSYLAMASALLTAAGSLSMAALASAVMAVIAVLTFSRGATANSCIAATLAFPAAAVAPWPTTPLWVAQLAIASGASPVAYLCFDALCLAASLLGLGAPLAPIRLLSAIALATGTARGGCLHALSEEVVSIAEALGLAARRLAAVVDDAIVCSVLALASSGILMHRLTTPYKIYFDEVYYVAEGAREILHSMVDLNAIHPPLAKEIMAASMALLGDWPLAWRLPGALLASAVPPAVYLTALWLLGSRYAALLAAVLVMLDPMFFVEARIAMLDIYVLAFSVLAMAAFSAHLRWGGLGSLYASGALFGLAVSSKLPGVPPYLLCLSMLAARAKGRRSYAAHLLAAYIALPACIYLAAYYPITLARGGLAAFLEVQSFMLTYSAYLPSATPHPYSSAPWTWPFMVKPLLMLYDEVTVSGERLISCICAFGNPLTWVLGLMMALQAATEPAAIRERGIRLAILWLLVCWLPYYPLEVMRYFGSGRQMYIYYFLQCVPPLCILLSRVLERLDEYFGCRVSALAIPVSAAFFALCYPVISGLPVPEDYIAGMKIMKIL